MYQSSEAPVKEGDELDVTIEAVGGKGDGIARVEGFVLFVPKTHQGERVKVRVTKVLQNVGFAELISRGTSEEKRPTQKERLPEKESEDEGPEEPDFEDTETFGEE
ncbi:TRAM domain-containing protein [Candidatus Woesearchaeota archaeon]|nr:TRAM domain-containing protein [Candidatus Woesearchaeota archaeon]